jgi:hypothetical protein
MPFVSKVVSPRSFGVNPNPLSNLRYFQRCSTIWTRFTAAQPHWNSVTNASLAKLIDEKTTGGVDAWQTNPWAEWDIEKRDNSLEHQSGQFGCASIISS